MRVLLSEFSGICCLGYKLRRDGTICGSVTGKGVQESWQFLLFDIDFDRSILIVNDVHACMRMHALVSIKLFLHLSDSCHVISTCCFGPWDLIFFPRHVIQTSRFFAMAPCRYFRSQPADRRWLSLRVSQEACAIAVWEAELYVLTAEKGPATGVEDLEVSRWRWCLILGKLYAKEQLVSE